MVSLHNYSGCHPRCMMWLSITTQDLLPGSYSRLVQRQKDPRFPTSCSPTTWWPLALGRSVLLAAGQAIAHTGLASRTPRRYSTVVLPEPRSHTTQWLAGAAGPNRISHRRIWMRWDTQALAIASSAITISGRIAALRMRQRMERIWEPILTRLKELPPVCGDPS